MNEEIKEILDYLKDENEYYDEEEQMKCFNSLVEKVESEE